MTDAPEAVQACVAIDGMTLFLVRHETVEDMLEELKAGFSECAEALYAGDDFPNGIAALTVGEVFDGEPRSTVFLPYGHEEKHYAELVSHEALHVAFALQRQRLQGSMSKAAPLPVTANGENESISEESVALAVGHVARSIWDMMEEIDKYKAKQFKDKQTAGRELCHK
jgi:hypothetical protein